MPEYSVPKGAKFGDIFVTTVDTVQASYIIDVLTTHNVPMLVAGNTGTGKTQMARDRLLNGINTEMVQAAKDPDYEKKLLATLAPKTKA